MRRYGNRKRIGKHSGKYCGTYTIVIAFGYINAKFELVTDPLFVKFAYVWKYAILGTVIIGLELR